MNILGISIVRLNHSDISAEIQQIGINHHHDLENNQASLDSIDANACNSHYIMLKHISRKLLNLSSPFEDLKPLHHFDSQEYETTNPPAINNDSKFLLLQINQMPSHYWLIYIFSNIAFSSVYKIPLRLICFNAKKGMTS